jgi:hypothetical protein
MIKTLKKRERAAYPSFMRQMQQIKTWRDLQEYCESPHVYVHLLGEKGYLIMTPSEVVDIVAGPKDIFRALSLIKTHFGEKTFVADFRESTSWRLIKVLERQNKVQLHGVKRWTWKKEVMYQCTVAWVY